MTSFEVIAPDGTLLTLTDHAGHAVTVEAEHAGAITFIVSDGFITALEPYIEEDTHGPV